jgi:hypothetical protein
VSVRTAGMAILPTGEQLALQTRRRICFNDLHAELGGRGLPIAHFP